jgi:hypothetical protein
MAAIALGPVGHPAKEVAFPPRRKVAKLATTENAYGWDTKCSCHVDVARIHPNQHSSARDESDILCKGKKARRVMHRPAP